MGLYINNKKIDAYGFAFDGCHKFYLIENNEQAELLEKYGYNLYLIDGLPRAWADSCSLRFIEKADLSEAVVAQFEPARFEGDGWDIDPALQWELDELAAEQEEANKAYEDEEG